MILFVHYDYRAYRAAMLNPEGGIDHRLWGQMLAGSRFDHIVVIGRPPTEGSIMELANQCEWHDCDLLTTLKPGGTIIYGPGANPHGDVESAP